MEKATLPDDDQVARDRCPMDIGGTLSPRQQISQVE